MNDYKPTYQANGTGFWYGLTWIQYECSNDPSFTWVVHYYAPKYIDKNKPDLETAETFTIKRWCGIL